MRNLGDSRLTDYPEPSRLSRQRLDILCERVARSIVGSASGSTGVLVGEVIQASVESFVTARGDVQRAARQVAPLLHQVGVREAQRHPDRSRVEQSFQLASIAVQRGLPLVVGDLITHDCLRTLRQDLAAYMNQLYRIVRSGFDRTIRVASMSQDDRLAELRAAAFRGVSCLDTNQLATAAGLDPTHLFTPIVAVHGPLPAAIREHPHALADVNGMQALIPESWDIEAIDQAVESQVVLGPPIALGKAYEGVVLTGNAATILRDGAVSDSRNIVPSTDLLSELLVRGNPLLAELLVNKHLLPMEELPLSRRMALSEMLLVSLERGLPLNQVARELGVASQTAHNRMKTLRQILGDKIDDADQRLELIVALRSARIRWTEL